MNTPFYIFPSANPAAAAICCAAWKAGGYRVAVAVDDTSDVPGADLVLRGAPWRGYYEAIRRLCLAVDSEIVICGGDDISPDPNHSPAEIAADFLNEYPDLYGIMQPTGDLATNGRPFAGTAHAAVSPWIGRGWIERAYEGNGPHWLGYWHLWGDQELQEVAKSQGVFVQRQDLKQYHAHWMRGHADNLPIVARERIKAQATADKSLFDLRKREGFPGSEAKQLSKAVA